jgi:type IV pilus assembly protein PilN
LIEINLLPSGTPRRAAARPSARPAAGLPKLGADPRVAALGAAAVVVLALAAFDFWRTGAQKGALAAQVQDEVADSVRLARSIELMKSLEGRRDTIEQKIEVIRAVDGRRYVWPHILDEVSRAVPPYTWLTKLSAIEEEETAPAPAPAPGPAKGDSAKAAADSAAADSAAAAAPPPGPGFNVEGNAATTQALTRFMKNLEASPMIRDVTLVTSEQTQTEGRVYQKFTLEARWEAPDSSLVETVPVVPVP